MNKIKGLLWVLMLISCAAENQNLTTTFEFDHPFKIKIEETRINEGSELSISFDQVLEDSRCPANVRCIWAGNAKVKLWFNNGTKEIPFNLNTHRGEGFRQDTIIDNIYIKLLGLSPYPGTPEYEMEAFQAELLVERD
ncbi:hypothetical protein [Xanthovirga aplysinae]|uniref:hypothetical protein n=1 Tax=Xanthovirga aplysinae TaxID=2529853 RepID=UPI0012BD574A|nr:hypothetical protein [Xanthovirga aplysinae]MTI30941.1 hypothetical protein [Xanthovirga aplysinae]